MIGSILHFLDQRLTGEVGSSRDDEPRVDAVQLATAALLVEMARADFEESPIERTEVAELLHRHFQLEAEEAEALLARARQQADEAVSLYRFTHLIHERLSQEEKHAVIELLWRVALADGKLDKYEDALAHKLADLLYVSHSDLMRLKDKVKRERSRTPAASHDGKHE